MLMDKNAKNILVIAPHPDDETLGCAGTLLKLKEERKNLYWLIVTAISKEKNFTKEAILQREKEIALAGKMYGFKKIFQLGLFTSELDKYSLQEIIKRISKVIEEVTPQIIFLPNAGDIHSDHRITFEASIACTKSFRYPYIEKIISYETLSETEFSPWTNKRIFFPNLFIDISKYIKRKISIMNIYKSEIKKHPFPRSKKSMEALAAFRGSTIGVKYAEAFMLIKEIVK